MPSQISLKIWARRAARATSMFSSAAANRLVRTDRAVCRAENWVMKTSGRIKWKLVSGKEELFLFCDGFLRFSLFSLKWLSRLVVMELFLSSLKKHQKTLEFTRETNPAISRDLLMAKCYRVVASLGFKMSLSAFEFWSHCLLAVWFWESYLNFVSQLLNGKMGRVVVQAHLGDIAGLVLEHCNNANIARKGVTRRSSFPSTCERYIYTIL